MKKLFIAAAVSISLAFSVFAVDKENTDRRRAERIWRCVAGIIPCAMTPASEADGVNYVWVRTQKHTIKVWSIRKDIIDKEPALEIDVWDSSKARYSGGYTDIGPAAIIAHAHANQGNKMFFASKFGPLPKEYGDYLIEIEAVLFPKISREGSVRTPTGVLRPGG